MKAFDIFSVLSTVVLILKQSNRVRCCGVQTNECFKTEALISGPISISKDSFDNIDVYFFNRVAKILI